MLIYGPVPSRRLGQSLGINNIPPKVCSYSCVYCQIGRTNDVRVKRCEFYQPEEIYRQTEKKLNILRREKRHVDVLSVVPDGEPTLDIHLGELIDLLKAFGIKIAVITNASLLWMDDVRKDLMKADWVSVKLDTVNSGIWKQINRPHESLDIEKVLYGITVFAKEFNGILATETMLIGGLNDDEINIRQIADYLSSIEPDESYLLVPIRPPTEISVKKPVQESLRKVYDIMRDVNIKVECIVDDEENDFYFTDNIAADLLNIAAVHPVREDVVGNLLKQRNLDWSVIDRLIEEKKIGVYMYEGKKFFKKIHST